MLANKTITREIPNKHYRWNITEKSQGIAIETPAKKDISDSFNHKMDELT